MKTLEFENILFLEIHAPPEKAPPARQHKEDFGSAVAMEGVAALGRLACGPDIEAVWDREMHMLVGGLRYAASDDCEVLFQIRAWRVRINERGAARDQITISNQSRLHVCWCHSVSPLVLCSIAYVCKSVSQEENPPHVDVLVAEKGGKASGRVYGSRESQTQTVKIDRPVPSNTVEAATRLATPYMFANT